MVELDALAGLAIGAVEDRSAGEGRDLRVWMVDQLDEPANRLRRRGGAAGSHDRHPKGLLGDRLLPPACRQAFAGGPLGGRRGPSPPPTRATRRLPAVARPPASCRDGSPGPSRLQRSPSLKCRDRLLRKSSP